MSGDAVKVFEYTNGSFQGSIALPLNYPLTELRKEVGRRLKLENALQILPYVFTDKLVQFLLEDIYRRTEGNSAFRKQECMSLSSLMKDVGAYEQSRAVSAKSKLDPLLTKAFEIVANPQGKLMEALDLLNSLRLGFVYKSRIGCSSEQPANQMVITQSPDRLSTLLAAQRNEGGMAYIFNMSVGRDEIAIVASTKEQLEERVKNLVLHSMNGSDILSSLLAKVSFE